MGNPTLIAPEPAPVAPSPKASLFAPLLGDTAFGDFLSRLTKQEQKATDQKDRYAESLEAAKGIDVYKYFLLINVAALEKYVAQTRIQAQLSFKLCKRVASVSFVLILLGVFLAIISPILPAIWKPFKEVSGSALSPASLSALVGIITQFISSVFFYLYNRTLQQFNLFGDKLSSAQRAAISLLVSGSITDDTARNKSSAEIAKALLAYSAPLAGSIDSGKSS